MALHVLAQRRPRVESLAAGRALEALDAGVVAEVLPAEQSSSSVSLISGRLVEETSTTTETVT